MVHKMAIIFHILDSILQGAAVTDRDNYRAMPLHPGPDN